MLLRLSCLRISVALSHFWPYAGKTRSRHRLVLSFLNNFQFYIFFNFRLQLEFYLLNNYLDDVLVLLFVGEDNFGNSWNNKISRNWRLFSQKVRMMRKFRVFLQNLYVLLIGEYVWVYNRFIYLEVLANKWGPKVCGCFSSSSKPFFDLTGIKKF